MGPDLSSAVMVQARHGNWAEKRQTYRARATSTSIQHHADRAAAREAEVHDHAIEAIDEAIPVDVLKGIIEATRGLAGTAAPEASPLPRLYRRPED